MQVEIVVSIVVTTQYRKMVESPSCDEALTAAEADVKDRGVTVGPSDYTQCGAPHVKVSAIHANDPDEPMRSQY